MKFFDFHIRAAYKLREQVAVEHTLAHIGQWQRRQRIGIEDSAIFTDALSSTIPRPGSFRVAPS